MNGLALHSQTLTPVIHKRSPRGGIENTLARYDDKVRLALEWIATFHFSTLPLIAKRLGIQDNTAFRFIQKLKQQKLIRGLDTFLIRRELLLLTPLGLKICTEMTKRLFSYATEPSKVNLNRVRHDLVVQTAVISRLVKGGTYFSERQITLEKRLKVPDALIESASRKTVLEVELTPKTDKRIYIGFENHIKALHEKIYDRVEYLFDSEILLNYYKKRFEAEQWPVYTYHEKQKTWVLKQDHGQSVFYFPQDDGHFSECFSFELANATVKLKNQNV